MLHKALPDYANKNAKVYFLVIDVGNDEKVLTHIKERERGLFESGFERVIGLRDMYSGEYDKKSGEKLEKMLIENLLKHTDRLSKR